MRADNSNSRGHHKKDALGASATSRPNDYCVPPVLVKDLTSQCAAHFVAHFVTNSEEHIRDVRRCGIRGPGGMIEEVEYWLYQCDSDVSGPNNNLGYWDLEEMGPWIYGDLKAADITRVVSHHTRGWSTKDFASYGYTLKDRAELDAAIAGMK